MIDKDTEKRVLDALSASERENSKLRHALHRIMLKAQGYAEAGNGQGCVLYALAVDALYGEPKYQAEEIVGG